MRDIDHVSEAAARLLKFGIFVRHGEGNEGSTIVDYRCTLPSILGREKVLGIIGSLNIVCISHNNQSTSIEPIYGRTMLFPEVADFGEPGANGVVSHKGSVDVRAIFDRTWLAELYYIQVASHQFHSNILKISISQ